MTCSLCGSQIEGAKQETARPRFCSSTCRSRAEHYEAEIERLTEAASIVFPAHGGST